MIHRPVLRPRAFIGPAALLIVLIVFNSACVNLCCFQKQVRDTRAKHFTNYAFDPGSELADRITTPPGFVLCYWSEEDGREYTGYALSADEIRMIRQCLDRLPEFYRTTLKKRLLGIYFVENFLGSGLADFVLNESGDVYTILLFNPTVLGVSLSELVTRKENTCFAADRPGLSVVVSLDDELPGLLYILLHEATHIMDYVDAYTPYVEPGMRQQQEPLTRKTPFSDRLWADYDRFRDDIVFAYQDRVTFYGMNGGPKINISEAAAVYRAMESIPVASLYSIFNWAEDFAEYMTFFYLTQTMGTDYAITVSDNGKILNQYRPFKNRIVLDRLEDLAATLQGGPDPP